MHRGSLDVKVGKGSVDPAWQPPRPVAQQREHGGDEGTTDRDGFMKIVEAHLVVSAVPEEEIAARLQRIRNDLTAAGRVETIRDTMTIEVGPAANNPGRSA